MNPRTAFHRVLYSSCAVDGGNEWYLNTERRQAAAAEKARALALSHVLRELTVANANVVSRSCCTWEWASLAAKKARVTDPRLCPAVREQAALFQADVPLFPKVSDSLRLLCFHLVARLSS